MPGQLLDPLPGLCQALLETGEASEAPEPISDPRAGRKLRVAPNSQELGSGLIAPVEMARLA